MKRNTLRCFGHSENNNNKEFVKKLYVSETECSRKRGRPVVRWKDRMKELLIEGEGVCG